MPQADLRLPTNTRRERLRENKHSRERDDGQDRPPARGALAPAARRPRDRSLGDKGCWTTGAPRGVPSVVPRWYPCGPAVLSPRDRSLGDRTTGGTTVVLWLRGIHTSQTPEYKTGGKKYKERFGVYKTCLVSWPRFISGRERVNTGQSRECRYCQPAVHIIRRSIKHRGRSSVP